MPDFSDRQQLTIGLVVANLAARGWTAAGLGALLGFLFVDLGRIPGEEEFELASFGMMATAGLYMVLPGLVVSVLLAVARRYLFPRVVWGNAHWIFPLMAGVVAIPVGWGLAG